MPLTRRIIPCFDISGKGVVKGIRSEQIEDRADPIAVARAFELQGADEIAVIDVGASGNRGDVLDEVLRWISERVFIPVIAGGGIRDLQDIKRMLHAGADRVMVNTSAVINPDVIRDAVKKFGGESLIGAVDVKRSGNSEKPWEVMTHGGRKASGLDARAWVQQLADYGIGEILVTSLDRDGSRKGFDLDLVETMSDIVTAPLLVAGGAGEPAHIAEVLGDGLADGVLIASIFHSGEYNIDNMKQYLISRGIEIRP